MRVHLKQVLTMHTHILGYRLEDLLGSFNVSKPGLRTDDGWFFRGFSQPQPISYKTPKPRHCGRASYGPHGLKCFDKLPGRGGSRLLFYK